jgi:hypothetical protein
MNLSEILSENSSNKSKMVWNYSSIHDNNILNCKEQFADKKEFIELKAASQTKKSIRAFLRKKIDLLNESFLKATEKSEKLQYAQKIKIFTDTLGAKERVSEKVFQYLTANQKTENKK